MGKCKDPANLKRRFGIKFVPSIQIPAYGLTFNKNLMINLKKNMAILACIPPEQLEKLLNTSESKSNYDNLLKKLEKHNFNLNPNIFVDINS